MPLQCAQRMLALAGLVSILIALPISAQEKGASIKLRASWKATPYLAEAAELVVGKSSRGCLLNGFPSISLV
jgi:hypothetical protein